jgi:Toprim-like
MNIKQAKSIRIEEVLRAIGAEEERAKPDRSEVWYRSPIRKDERTASFKVDALKNTWYDHGMGKGGDVIDLARAHTGGSVSDALKWLETFDTNNDAASRATPPPVPTTRRPAARPDTTGDGYTLRRERDVKYPAILAYAAERGIPQELLRLYCKEVAFDRTGAEKEKRSLFGIGFGNDANGYEVRGIQGNFKAVIGHKSITTLQSDDAPTTAHVFEGFFDFLTFARLMKTEPHTMAIVLNSAALAAHGLDAIAKRPTIERVCTWFDNDERGRAITQDYADALGEKSHDMGPHYAPSVDLNQFYQDHRTPWPSFATGEQHPRGWPAVPHFKPSLFFHGLNASKASNPEAATGLPVGAWKLS